MSRARFGLLLALLAAVVTVASFAVGVAVLDDDSPDPPPDSVGTDAGSDADGATSTTGATSTSVTIPGQLASPAWVTVVSSETDELTARANAAQLLGTGFPSGVLRSDDYESLSPGFWVTYAGPFPSFDAAEAAVADLAAAGIDGAYARCVGTDDDCGGTPAPSDQTESDDESDD